MVNEEPPETGTDETSSGPVGGMALSTEAGVATEEYARRDLVEGIPEPVESDDAIADAGVVDDGLLDVLRRQASEGPYEVLPEPTPGPATDVSVWDIDNESARVWRNADKSITPVETKYAIARSWTQRSDLDPQEVIKEQEPGLLETMAGWVEPADIPRRSSWQGGYRIGSMAPDPTKEGEAPTVVSTFGDLASYGLEKFMVSAFGPSEWPTISSSIDYEDNLEKIGSNLYKAISEGTPWKPGGLHKKGVETGPLFLDRDSFWYQSNPTGTHLLDAAIPKELAAKLYDSSGASVMTPYWYMLTTDAGRLANGLALEIILDPLWLFGPAKAAELVTVAGKVMRADSVVTQAAGMAASASKELGSKRQWLHDAVRLVTESGDDVKDVRDAFTIAGNHAANNADAARQSASRLTNDALKADSPATLAQAIRGLETELEGELALLKVQAEHVGTSTAAQVRSRVHQKKIAEITAELDLLTASPNAAKVKKILLRKAKYATVRASSWASNAEAIRRFVRVADAAESSKDIGKLVREKSILPIGGTYHIPGSQKTVDVLSKSQIQDISKRVTSVLPDDGILVSVVDKAKNWKKPLTISEIRTNQTKAIEQGLSPTALLTPGQKLLLIADEVGVKPAKLWSKKTWDFVAQTFGTRHIQPLIASVSSKMEMAHYGARGSFMMQLPWSSKYFMELKRVEPQTWANYQEAVTKHIHALTAGEANVMSETQALLSRAVKMLPNHKRWAKEREAEVVSEIADVSGRIAEPMADAERVELAQKLRNLEFEQRELWNIQSKDYGPNNLLDDAADYHERGSSVFERNSAWLEAMTAGVAELKARYAGTGGVTELTVATALVRMTQLGKGDKLRSEAYVQRLHEIYQFLDDAPHQPLAEVNMTTFLEYGTGEVGSTMKLLTRLGRDKIAEVVENVYGILDTRPFNDETAQIIRNMLSDVVGNDQRLVDEVLSYAVGAYGHGNPEKALTLFAMDITGDLSRVADALSKGQLHSSGLPPELFTKRGTHFHDVDTPESVGPLMRGQTVEEAMYAIKDMPVEYGVFYDNGMQVARARGKQQYIEMPTSKDISEAHAAGNVWFIHNHPLLLKDFLGGLDKPTRKFIKKHGISFDEMLPPMHPSPSDFVIAVVKNENRFMAVGQDGTYWLMKRPDDGWPLKLPEGLSESDKALWQDEQIQQINKIVSIEMGGWTKGFIERLSKLVAADLKVVDELLSAGKVTKKQHRTLKIESIKRWGEHAAKQAYDEINYQIPIAINAHIYTKNPESAGIAATRHAIGGRYVRSGVVDIDTATGVYSVERGLTRKRILKAVEDKITETKRLAHDLKELAETTELVSPALAIEGISSVLSTTIKLRADDFVSAVVGHFKGARFVPIEAGGGVHPGVTSAIADADKLEYQFMDMFNSWVRSNYPNGKPLLDSKGDNIALSARDWLNGVRQQIDIPDSITANNVEGWRRKYINFTSAESQMRNFAIELTESLKRAKTGRGEKGRIFTKKEVRHQARSLREKRMAEALDPIIANAVDEADAIQKIKRIFDNILDVADDPLKDRLSTSMSEQIAKSMLKGEDLEGALSKARDKTKSLAQNEITELKESLRAATPRLEIPRKEKGKTDIVALKDWEESLWSEFKEMTKELTEEETLMAAFTALRDAPRVMTEATVGKELLEHLTGRYKQLYGSRYDEVPPTLKPLVEMFGDFIKKYEDLYVEHGMTFVKDPEAMMRFWGVMDYTPHMQVKNEVIAEGGYASAVTSRQSVIKISSTLEDHMSTSMDQKNMRSIAGTIKEINHAVNTPGKTFTIDPMGLVARYAKANQAMSAQDFMFALLRGKVVRPFRSRTAFEHELDLLATRYRVAPDVDDVEAAVRNSAGASELARLDELKATPELRVSMGQVAKDLGYVPLFERAVKSLNMDLLVNQGADAWRAAGIDVDDVIKAVQQKNADFSPFAKWIQEVPEFQQGDNIIKMMLAIKAKDFSKVDPKPLFDPIAMQKMYMDGHVNKLKSVMKKRGKTDDEIHNAVIKNSSKMQLRAWDDVAEKMNSRSADLQVGVKVNNGAALQTFFDQGQEMWRLYVPHGVARSMDDLFTFAERAREGTSGAVVRIGQLINNFWKLRVTIIAAAFSARNHLSNKFSQILDVDLDVLLNPKLTLDASNLTMLVGMHEKYGGIDNAIKYLTAPKSRYETKLQYTRRQAEAEYVDILRVFGDEFDLGDGIYRSADDAIAILREHNVISGAFTQYVDVGEFEKGLAEVMYYGGIKRNTDKIKKWASVAEDALIYATPVMMTGTLWPIGLPKSLGAALARNVENHARIGSFIANVKRTKNFEVASKHVDQFLFNYGDLTGAQKVWMRLFIPFFTWQQKNMAVQLKMMQEKPVFYSQFNRILMVMGPEIVEAYNAEQAGVPYVPAHQTKPINIRTRQSHTRNLVRFPLPGHKGAYIEGFGLPLEPFAETAGLITSSFQPSKWFGRYDERKPNLRMLGQMHWALKTLGEASFQYNTFYDRPISEMTNGRLIAQTIAGIRKTPLVGDSLGDTMADVFGLYHYQPYNSRLGQWTDDIRVGSMANYVFGNLPYSRVLRDASAATMAYNFSLLNTSPEALGSDVKRESPINDAWRITDAMTGLRIISDDPAFREKIYQYRLDKAHSEYLRRHGVIRQYQVDYPRRKP